MSSQRFSNLGSPALIISGILWIAIYFATMIIGVSIGQFEPGVTDAHWPLIINILIVLAGHWFLPLSSFILGLGLISLFVRLGSRSRVLGITALVFSSIALILSMGNLILLSGFLGNIGRSLIYPNNLLGGFSAFTVSIATGFIGGALLRADMSHRWMAIVLIAIGILTIPILLATPLPTSIAPDWATDTIAFLVSGIGYTAVGVKMMKMNRNALEQQVNLSTIAK